MQNRWQDKHKMLRLISSKKGLIEIILTPTFITLIVLGVILISMLGKINALGSQTSFEKKFLATDLGVAVNAMHAINGNAYLNFAGLAKYNLSYGIGPSIVEVFQGAKEKDKEKGSYPFTEDGPGGIYLLHSELKPKNESISTVFLIKQGSQMRIDSPEVSQLRANLKAISCSSKRFSPLQSLVIDPGHGWSESEQKGSRGFVNQNNNWAESAKTLELANRMQMLNRLVASIKSTRGWAGDNSIAMQSRIDNAKQAEGIISLHVGSSPFLENRMLAYYNVHSEKKEQSIQLGCHILNAVSNAFPEINAIALIPVNVEQELMIDPESHYAILLPGSVAVLLEIGNIQSPSPNIVIDKQLELVRDGIFKGVSEYQGIQ